MLLKRIGLLAVTVMMIGALSVTALAADAPVTALDDAAEATGEVVHVSIKNFAYADQEITVAPGTTVVWTNDDAVGHNVDLYTGDGNPLEESVVGPMLNKGQSFAVTFNAEGVYEYLCDPHPFMTGTVNVEA